MFKKNIHSKSIDNYSKNTKEILTQKVSTLPLSDEQRKIYLFLYEQTYFVGQDESNFLKLNTMSDILSIPVKNLKRAFSKLVRLNLVKEIDHEETDGSTAFKYHVFLPQAKV